MIPKVIHYCWFGGNPKPELIDKCIASWKAYCPDWEIREWNEENYDVSAHPFVKCAYGLKKWAFVSDVARLDIISRNGGIYLDTDVELVGELDFLTKHDAFFAFESDRNLNSGLGFGAVAGHPTVKAMLEYYDNERLYANGKLDTTPCPAKNTEALQTAYPQFKRNGQPQTFAGIQILGSNDYAKFAIHHGAMSWVDGPVPEKHIYKDTKLKRLLRKPEFFDYLEKHFGKKTTAVYTFLAYDLLEMGPVYYIKRLAAKMKHRKG